ncbi:MAG: hypothetical protein IJA52_00365 [Clostridia bacterium]|nr:hypothetical protein [Clostridia bacterium]
MENMLKNEITYDKMTIKMDPCALDIHIDLSLGDTHKCMRRKRNRLYGWKKRKNKQKIMTTKDTIYEENKTTDRDVDAGSYYGEYSGKNYTLSAQTETYQEFPREDIDTVNIKDAANYLIQLFYNAQRECTSAVIQKLLVIAQMRFLKLFGIPLFNEDITVKPLCFSVDFVSVFYPIYIFSGTEHGKAIDTIPQNLDNQLDIIRTNDTLPKLSSFMYIIEGTLSKMAMKVLDDVYAKFGIYSGNSIGAVMRDMNLHKEHKAGNKITFAQLLEYVNGLCASKESSNVINSYVCSDQ